MRPLLLLIATAVTVIRMLKGNAAGQTLAADLLSLIHHACGNMNSWFLLNFATAS
jgi:hypothetical protein